MSPSLPPKKSVALALLENTTVFVHLDPRGQNVRVPPWFKKQPQLVLQIGLNMPVPIPDLRLDDESVSCTLSFNRSPFYCHIPWEAVFALVGENRRGMVWPDDVPREVAVQLRRQVAKAAIQQKEQVQSSSSKRSHLRAVPTGASSGKKTDAGTEPVKPAEQAEADSQGEGPAASPETRAAQAAEKTTTAAKPIAKTAKEAAKKARKAARTAKKAAKKAKRTASKASKKTARKAITRKAAKKDRLSTEAGPTGQGAPLDSAPRQAADTSNQTAFAERPLKPDAVQESPSTRNGDETPPASPLSGAESASTSENSGPKSKRKLPPYLRVVK